MKILHIAETVKGGIASVIQLLINNSPDYIEHYIVLPEDQEKYITIDGTKRKYLFARKKRGIGTMVRLHYTYLKAIKNIKPDIIHLHSSFSAFTFRTTKPFYFPFSYNKIIYCPHAFSFLMDNNSLINLFYARIEKCLSHLTSNIICTSNYEMNLAIQFGMSVNKLKVIHNSISSPVPISKLPPNPYNKKGIKILFVGRFDHQKGYDDMVSLVNKLDPEKFNFTAVGDFVNDNDTQNRNPLISYTGWIDRVSLSAYYYYADFLFMPSRWESFGLVAVEAQSYGTPVIARKAASLPEIIIDGITGKLYHKNISELADFIAATPKSYWSNMQSACILNYKNNFDSTFMTNKVYALYNDVLHESPDLEADNG